LATSNKGATRPAIADLWKRITRLQTKYDLPAYSVAVLETRGGLHAHITFIGTREIARRLQSSSAFGELIDVRPVTDSNGLVHKYLSKERTPQAGYGREHLLGGRLKGSHRLEGGGDRVRLSRALERDAIEAGYVDAWPHSNARRSFERSAYRPRTALRPAGRNRLGLSQRELATQSASRRVKEPAATIHSPFLQDYEKCSVPTPAPTPLNQETKRYRAPNGKCMGSAEIGRV
jgi:hypothetical protein